MPGALEGDAVREHDRHEERESQWTDWVESPQREQRENDGEQPVADTAARWEDAGEHGVNRPTGSSRGKAAEEHGDGALHRDRVLRIGGDERNRVHRQPATSTEDRKPEQATQQGAAKPSAHGGNIGAT